MSDSHELPDGVAQRLRLDAEDGPARRLDALAAQGLIEGVLDDWQAPSRGRRRPLLLLSVAALCIGVGSAAAFYVAGGLGGPEPAPAQPLRASGVAEPTQTPSPEPSVERAAPAEAAVPTPAPEEAPGARRTVEPRAQDLLALANELRGKGRYRAAEQAYLRATRSQPGSAAAYVARIAAADLRLQHLEDAKGALALYKRALRAPSSALSVEAHAGVAKAQRALGNTAAEVEALQRLLSAHPSGPSAEWAKRRLEALWSSSP